jgi:hypothetical protein
MPAAPHAPMAGHRPGVGAGSFLPSLMRGLHVSKRRRTSYRQKSKICHCPCEVPTTCSETGATGPSERSPPPMKQTLRRLQSFSGRIKSDRSRARGGQRRTCTFGPALRVFLQLLPPPRPADPCHANASYLKTTSSSEVDRVGVENRTNWRKCELLGVNSMEFTPSSGGAATHKKRQ